MKAVSYSSLSASDITSLCARPRIDFTSIMTRVATITEEVRVNGDAALMAYTKQFDGVEQTLPCVPLSTLEMPVLRTEVAAAFDVAYANIRRFHEAQFPKRIEVETMPGVHCFREARAIERVGLYIPGGTAVLPSSTLMLGVPAQLAGCSTIVVATPPRADGSVCPEVLYVAKKIGATHLLLAGGAQAIAAMAYGTASVPKVDKILGPGNQFVTAAKMQLQNSDAMVSIDMPAGPSEVLVMADAKANPAFVAADVLSQAEHGADSQVVLVTLPGFPLETLQAELTAQTAALPRAAFAQKALDHSFIVQCSSIQDAFAFSNAYAPEHLILALEDAASYTHLIQHAGSVFLGTWTPESLGDYASGTNHTLPTYGYARMYSGVSLDSFFRHITFQEVTTEGLNALGPVVEVMAEVEGLQAHKQAVSIRLRALSAS